MRRTVTLAAFALMAVAAPLAAQGGGGGGGGGRQGGQGGRGNAITTLIAAKDTYKLTDDQVKKLTPLADSVTARGAAMRTAMTAANGDQNQMTKIRDDNTAWTNNQIKAVLTADQMTQYTKAQADMAAARAAGGNGGGGAGGAGRAGGGGGAGGR